VNHALGAHTENRVKATQDIPLLSCHFFESVRRIAKRPEFAAANCFGYRERIASKKIDVLENQRRKSRNIVRIDLVSLSGELLENGV